jgi:hypothetical protein
MELPPLMAGGTKETSECRPKMFESKQKNRQQSQAITPRPAIGAGAIRAKRSNSLTL